MKENVLFQSFCTKTCIKFGQQIKQQPVWFQVNLKILPFCFDFVYDFYESHCFLVIIRSITFFFWLKRMRRLARRQGRDTLQSHSLCSQNLTDLPQSLAILVWISQTLYDKSEDFQYYFHFLKQCRPQGYRIFTAMAH